MGRIQKYFKSEFQVRNFSLDHVDPADFYLTCFQRNRSAIPMFCIRALVFAGSLSIIMASLILTTDSMPFKYWPIYLTHWGVFLITVASAAAFIVSVASLKTGIVDASFGLPWYVKAYWVFLNITVPIAFFITVFYWSLLTQAEEEFAIDPVLDVFIHAVNSVLMLVLLMFSRHPVRLLHFYQPLLLGVVYLIFSIVYFYTGGTDAFGQPYVYPMLNWTYPGTAAITTVGSALLIIVMHGVMVLISVLRDNITKRCRKNPRSLDISNDAYN